MAKSIKHGVVLSFTGNAGPEAMDGQPVGKVFITYKDSRMMETYEFDLFGGREEIRLTCVNLGLQILEENL